MTKQRPNNKQLQKMANRLSYYDWSDLEMTELVRRIRKIKPSQNYLAGVRAAVEAVSEVEVFDDEEIKLKHLERLNKIVAHIEQEAGEKQHIITLN